MTPRTVFTWAITWVACALAAGEARGIALVPTFTNGYGETWTTDRRGVINRALSDWGAAILDNHTVAINFTFSNTGFAEWHGGYSGYYGDNIRPWSPGTTHTVTFNVNYFSTGLDYYVWWDPTPEAADDQPNNTWDALSLTRHEIGHAMGVENNFYFDNWGLPSQVDRWRSRITINGNNAVFDAAGLNVPLAASDNLSHVANSADLMSPALVNHLRKEISRTDLSMLRVAYNYTLPNEFRWQVLQGNFESPGNWTPAGGPPGSGDAAVFSRGAASAYTVTFGSGADTVNRQLRVDNDRVTFNLGGRTYQLTQSSQPSVVVGEAAVGMLTISGGTLAGVDAVVGKNAGSTGQVTVTGAAAHWNLSGNMYLGGSSTAQGGSGTLQVTSGGAVSVTGILRAYGGGFVDINGGTVSAAALSIDPGAIVQLAGSISGLGTGGSRVDVSNNSSSPGLKVLGTNQQVGHVTGNGSLYVAAGADLTALSIQQNTLTISGRLSISAASYSALSATPVPEPTALAMLAGLAVPLFAGLLRFLLAIGSCGGRRVNGRLPGLCGDDFVSLDYGVGATAVDLRYRSQHG